MNEELTLKNGNSEIITHEYFVSLFAPPYKSVFL